MYITNCFILINSIYMAVLIGFILVVRPPQKKIAKLEEFEVSCREGFPFTQNIPTSDL